MTNASRELTSVHRLAHVSLRTERMEQMVEYYTSILGLRELENDGTRIQLGLADGTPAVELVAGKQGLDHVALDLSSSTDIELAATELSKAKVDVSEWANLTPAGANSIGIVDSEGTTLQLIVRDRAQYVAPTESTLGVGIQPVKIGHVATRATDVARVREFYSSNLGFRFADSIGDRFLFMRCNADHHSLNFLQAERPASIHHIAFQLQNWDHVRVAVNHLVASGIQLIWGPGRHGPGHNIFTYHYDPDGNIIELFADLDTMTDEDSGYYDWRPWHEGVQRPRRWDPDTTPPNLWGPRGPEGFLA